MRAVLISTIGLLAVAGCSGGDKDGGGTTTPGTSPTGGDTGTVTDTDTDTDTDTTPTGTTPIEECDPAAAPFYDQAGTLIDTYDCNTLDKCTETDIGFFTACCNCDPYYCNPAPPGTCPDDTEEPPDPNIPVESCMTCHNGSNANDYAGTGIGNPHPFTGAAYVLCSDCHGGNPDGVGKEESHVPNPPQIGDDLQLQNDAESYFNFLTLTGVDKWPDYTGGPNNDTYTALDWLQFRNPGDLRVVSNGYSCGASGCHGGEHADWVNRGVIATETGFYSATLYTQGIDNYFPERRDWYQGTASDYGFRYVEDPNYANPLAEDLDNIGAVPSLEEFPEHAEYGDTSGMYQNLVYDADTIANFVYQANEENGARTNSIKAGSPLSDLIRETVQQACGDCHLGSAGANNRYADFRSSGCTSCHMQYTLDGRSRSSDVNVPKLEPANPDAIQAPERPHIEAHQIRNVAKILPNGAFVRGITDNACVGCHQGSNRTVLQYWGIRLDQNQDVTNDFQYPANPDDFEDTAQDTRLYDPAVQNNTFNGREAAQYLLYEDYDADQRDDTPPDIHYEAGLGCIDCHGSRDVHNGTDGDDTSGMIPSREDQAVKVECETCHGDETSYAYTTTDCYDYEDNPATCAMDRNGNPVRNVTVDGNGDYWLVSRVDGQRHYVPQTLDVIVNSQKTHPITSQSIYTAIGSYAMGAADGSATTGTGPLQTDPNLYTDGFTHMENVECTACHSAWQNNCIGCHLDLIYQEVPNTFFSNTTGVDIVTNFAANFTYQNPVLFTMMVGSRNRVTEGQSGMKMFFRYTDYYVNTSDTLAFSDVNGDGNNPTAPREDIGALAHNRIRAHSTRGRVDADNEGPRYCVACHLNTDSMNNFGADYEVFFDAYVNRDYVTIENEIGLANLAEFIGENTGNQNNNPYFVHMAAGLGTALFLFDANGCPINPVDDNADRFFCEGTAPAENFANVDLANDVAYDLDSIVNTNGIKLASTTHPMLEATFTQLRDGALHPNLAGPLGASMITKLADPNFGVILDSWIDADGAAQGDAADYLQYN